MNKQKQMIIRLSPKQHIDLKLYAVKQGKTICDVIKQTLQKENIIKE